MAERLAPAVEEGRCRSLTWAACASAYPGQARSGDAYLVEPTESGVLVAVADGLGHGEEAADAAARALASVHETAGRSLVGILSACHTALHGSRGVVMTLACIGADRLQWAAVGNVDAAVLRPGRRGAPVGRWSVPLRAGVLGDRLPPLRDATVDLEPGDTLVMATDGLSPDFLDGVDPYLPPRAMAASLHRAFARDDDDALVLVVRCEDGSD